MSASFNAANQARCSIKMKLSNFAWYKSSHIALDGDEYVVVVSCSVPITDAMRREIPAVLDGVSIKSVNGK
jgi:hypothetical protein